MRYICTAVVAMLALVGASFAATINVPGDYATIQGAIDASDHGDEVLVAPGTYTGSGSHVVDMKGKEITLRAAGAPEETIIDGEGTRRGVVFHSGETPNTKLVGFTIYRCRNAYYDYDENGSASWWEQQLGGGLLVYSCSPKIENCTMLENSSAWDGGGAYLAPYEAQTSPLFVNCKFIANSAQYGGGIRGDGSDLFPTLLNCEFINNSSTGTWYDTGGGIHTRGSSNWYLENCVFEGNTAANGGGGIGMDELVTAELVNCRFTNNSAAYGGGLSLLGGSNASISNCVFNLNTASLDGGGLRSGGNCNFSLNDSIVCGNDPDQIYGDWTDNGGNTVADECSISEGACCVGSSCSVETEADCVSAGGTYQGDNSDCSDGLCYGACCVTSGCDVMAEVMCTNLGGTWLGAGGSCDDCPAPCMGDTDGNGVVNIEDLLIVIGGWGVCP